MEDCMTSMAHLAKVQPDLVTWWHSCWCAPYDLVEDCVTLVDHPVDQDGLCDQLIMFFWCTVCSSGIM
jgi:hypothetical protein